MLAITRSKEARIEQARRSNAHLNHIYRSWVSKESNNFAVFIDLTTAYDWRNGPSENIIIMTTAQLYGALLWGFPTGQQSMEILFGLTVAHQ